jgi:hypothetical protein
MVVRCELVCAADLLIAFLSAEWWLGMQIQNYSQWIVFVSRFVKKNWTNIQDSSGLKWKCLNSSIWTIWESCCGLVLLQQWQADFHFGTSAFHDLKSEKSLKYKWNSIAYACKQMRCKFHFAVPASLDIYWHLPVQYWDNMQSHCLKLEFATFVFDVLHLNHGHDHHDSTPAAEGILGVGNWMGGVSCHK